MLLQSPKKGDVDVVEKGSRIREAEAPVALSLDGSTEIEYQVRVRRVAQILSRRVGEWREARGSGARGAVSGGELRVLGGRRRRVRRLLPRPGPRRSPGFALAHGQDKERIEHRQRRPPRRYLATHRTRRVRRLSSLPGLLVA